MTPYRELSKEQLQAMKAELEQQIKSGYVQRQAI